MKKTIFAAIIFCCAANFISAQHIADKELISRPEVRKMIKKYSCNASIKVINRSFKKGENYLFFIEEKIAEMDLPPDLIYLPLVESNYSINAVSRSGAIGLWQFMTNSIAPFGIYNDNWTDERRDFWKSTEGALKKLRYNYKVTGDWLLAIGAYNCGLGRMTRLVKDNNCNDFFELCKRGVMPSQTADYVPKFLAFSYICRNSRNFTGLNTSYKKITWEKIPINGGIDLRILSKKSGIPLHELQTGNMELNTHFTPPDRDDYFLKIKKSYSRQVRKIIAEKKTELIRTRLHTIKTGETFTSIAAVSDTSVAILKKFNPEVNPSQIKAGEVILIPVFTDKIIRDNTENNKDYTREYTVQKGDTLWGIARKFGSTIEDLAQANGLNIDDSLVCGLKIFVPGENDA
jgi:membrane-bound lytic murein transglycosylase D